MLHTVWNLPSYHTGVLLLSVLLLKSSLLIRQQTVPGKFALANCYLLVKSEAHVLTAFCEGMQLPWCRKMERPRFSHAVKWSHKQHGSEKRRGHVSTQDGSSVNCASCPVPHQSSAPYRSDSPSTVTLPTYTLWGSQPSPHVTHTVQGLSHRITEGIKLEKFSDIIGSNLWPKIPVSTRPGPWAPRPVLP